MITQPYLGKKLTYGYQGQKYGFQDKTYGCPYGKKGFLAGNSAVAFFMPVCVGFLSFFFFAFCRITLSADKFECYKFTHKFHKMLYCYQLY